MVNFRIWYLDGTIVDGSTIEDWTVAPENDVLVIGSYLYTDDYNRKIGQYYAYSDWYWMIDGEIYQNNISSPEDVNAWVDNPAPEGAISKRAIWTTDEHMEQVINEMWEWIA